MWIARTDHVVVKDNYQPLQSRRDPPQIATEFPGSTDVTLMGNNFPLHVTHQSSVDAQSNSSSYLACRNPRTH